MKAVSNRKAIYGWALYDWANSAFATTVMAGFFPIFFKKFSSAGMDATESTFNLGVANSAASLIVLLIAPIIGAIADHGNNRRRFLAAFACLGIVTTALLFVVAQGQWLFAAILYTLAIIGFSGANVFYDALLISISKDDQHHRISALGFALGYLGGGILFALNVFMTIKPEVFGFSNAAEAVRWSFVSVAIWWALFSIPLFLWVPEPQPSHDTPLLQRISCGFRALASTIGNLKKHRIVLRFLIAYWLYIDGVDTIIRMAVAYGSDIGLPSDSMIKALLLTQFVGFPAAICFGRIGEKIGAKKGIMIAIGIYSVVTIYSYFLHTAMEFYGLALCIGLVQGGIQSLSRSMFSQLIPQDKSAEFFGFYNMMGKFAAVIGPVLIGTVGALSNNPRLGVLAVLVLFIAGGWILRAVPEKPALRT